MVFESLVVDLMNRFLGDYVENLDRSQLKLGIWGGDAVLKNLDLKESALDELDLPVRIKVGHIAKLTLKIPWKNLYEEPVVAELDGVYALAVPNIAIKYNADKEEAYIQDVKQKKLAAVEEAKKIEAEKNKPQEVKQDSFVEKLVAQIIKNLQVQVSNIHIRYEDHFTNPKHPFAIGFSLQDLVFQTTDKDWTPCIVKDAVSQIYKLVRLNSLSVYWNSQTTLYEHLSREEILGLLKDNIAGPDNQTNFTYLIKPIQSVAHLRLHTKPEEDKFTIPKIFLTIVFDNIELALTKNQYDDILEMLESFERMAILSLYRKYRPDVPLHGNASCWWNYCYNCILEETVRRRRRMFSWDHIKNHRNMMKKYKEAYVKKLSLKKLPGNVQTILEECEKFLDVFSVLLMRQQADVEAAKLGAEKANEQQGGWFSGWWGTKQPGVDKTENKGIQDQFYELYTPEEKARLYGAIGYEENESVSVYPKEYVAVQLVTKLNCLAVSIRDEKENIDIMKLQLNEVISSIAQRPAANALLVNATMDQLTIFGSPQNKMIPKMMSSKMIEGEDSHLLTIKFETNPLDGSCDTRVVVGSQPLRIIYDAITVNSLAGFFKPPESVYLKQLSQAAMAKFNEVKQLSTTGLKHAIEQHKFTDIVIDLKSSYVIVPEGGFNRKNARRLILDLGNFTVNSEKNKSNFDFSPEANVEELLQSAYDKFNIKLDNIQMLLVHPGEDWQSARKAGESPLHILQPISINILFQKCMFDNQVQLAKMKAFGELPLLSLYISDHKLQEILQLVQSIPFPESAPPPPDEDIIQGPSILPSEPSLASTDVPITSVQKESGPTVKKMSSTDYVNLTDMELKFEIKEVCINIAQKLEDKEAPLLQFKLFSLGTNVSMRTFDMSAGAYLGGIFLNHFASDDSGKIVKLIHTPETTDTLLSVDYLKANLDAPDFDIVYKNTEQSISVSFSMLELLLDQSCIIDLLQFAQKLTPPEDKASHIEKSQDSTTSIKLTKHTSTLSLISTAEKKLKEEEKKPGTPEKKAPKKKGKTRDPNIIDIQVLAKLDTFSIGISSPTELITSIKVKGINADVKIQVDKTTIGAELKDIAIFNPTPDCYYPKILAIEGSEVLKCDIVAYNSGTEGNKIMDMSCVDTSINVTMGCMRLVFLNKFVNDLLGFLNQFQAAKDKISEAGEKMAELTQETVANLQETASRIALCIKMKAPLILVPQNSKSLNILLVDLGKLDISNSFHSVGPVTNNKPAVIDKMKIQLTSLKMSRALLNKENEIGTECLLLQPVTLNLDVNRNLSAGWYHDEPDMSIEGKQDALALCLSQYDYAVIMAMLNENLSEGQPPAPEENQVTITPAVEEAKKTKQETAGHLENIEETLQAKDAPQQNASPSKEEKASTPVPVYARMKFKFTLNSLSATLYQGKDELVNQSERVVARDPQECLGYFELQLFDVDFKMQSDNSMQAVVILKDTILDDSRPEKENGIKRMIQRYSKGPSSPGTDNMIDVNFTQSPTADKDIAVKVTNLHVCVCLDFLMTLGNFFTKGLADAPPPPVEIPGKEVAKSVKPPPAAAPVRPTSSMNIMVTISVPEIVMIEDQSNHETNALVLYSDVKFKMQTTPETSTMSADIRELQIVSTTFNKKEIGGTQILNSCEIAFHSSAPFNEYQHMQIQTSDLVFNISPATIRTMTAIATGLSSQPAEETETEEVKIPENLWNIKPLHECDFWYLKSVADVDIPPLPEHTEETDVETVSRGEQLLMNIPTLVIKLEGGVGQRTVPLLIVESAFDGEVKDWSSKLTVLSSLKLEVAYYNENLSVWEPLIEPVVQNNRKKRWMLTTEVVTNDDNPVLEEDLEPIIPPAKMVINIRSTDKLELILTKTCLEVLSNLGKAFGDAYRLVEPTAKIHDVLAPYIIENQTGLELLLKLDNVFQMPPDADSGRVKLAHDCKLELNERMGSLVCKRASVIKATQEGVERKLLFQVEKFGAIREVTIKRAEKRSYLINQQSYAGDVWSIVCNTEVSYGQRLITLQSVIQVLNHLPVPVEIFYSGPTQLEKCGVAQCEEIFNIPLNAVYSSSSEFYFSPFNGQYSPSEEPINWREVEDKGMYQIHCGSTDTQESYYLNVCPEIEEIYLEQQEKIGDAKLYTLHLRPTVIVHNLLPMTIRCFLKGTTEDVELKPGENTPLFNACIGTSDLEVKIPNYQGNEWIGTRTLVMNMPDLSLWTFKCSNSDLSMDLGLHYKAGGGSLDMTFYSPYWMINKTGQDLVYKSSDSEDHLTHPSDHADILLFSFKSKSIFHKKKAHKDKEGNHKSGDKGDEKEKKEKEKKVKEWRQHGKACLQVADSDWSDKFSLDTVGSSGTITCKNKASGTYEVGVNIRLSSSGLTKIVTFTPYYMLINTSELSFLLQENTPDPSGWIEVQPQQCVPFWPLTNKMELKAKVKDSNEETSLFPVSKPHSTLLKLENQYSGINIECQATEIAMVTTLASYRPGMATVLLVNHIDRCSIQFNQKDVKTTHMLGSEQAMLYTWEDPAGNRELLWTCGTKKDVKNHLTEDGIGEFFADNDTKVYWVSFLDGMQRVLLFSQDLALVTVAQQAGELERIEQEINLFIFGLGLSLVNNLDQTEVAYLGITSSGIIWEEKKKRFKAMDMKSSGILETGYQKYQDEIALGKHPNPRKLLENKYDVDFTEMIMYKPNKRVLRRGFQDGIWVQYKTSPHQLQLHAKINRLQLDNQISGAVFPTVLAPIPPPKSVAAESVPKPFTEVSIMQRKHEHSNVVQIKYFKVLIQEMSAKVDQGFLNAIIQLFSSEDVISRIEETRLFLEDCKGVQTELLDIVGLSLVEEQKNFYDYLHFSPIKIHLSFSLQAGEDGQVEIKSNVLNIFLQSVGVVLTDIQDVIFKLGYFERKHSFYNQSQLIGQMSQHYAGQAIKQMYVLVLGLDVLGNPFGLIRGLGEGLEDLFYEPYQGAIQGPEEFAEGLALGVRSLFGHAVGGAAGAVSRITGAMGKGIAALTLDDDYQKKRREAMNKRPANVREGFARGGKGLVMGVVDGVTGIVRKPIEGAQKEGVEGFFKGIGKGLVGVVTRPTSGVVDFASGSLDSIRRIAEMSDEVRRLRPPRRFHNDMIIRPYNHQEAEGYAILQETEKGIYAATDEYIAHVVVTKDGKNVLLVTDKRLVFANRGDIFGHWDCEWTHTYSELGEVPKSHPKGIEVILKEKEKKKFFSSNLLKKLVIVPDPKVREWILAGITEAMARS